MTLSLKEIRQRVGWGIDRITNAVAEFVGEEHEPSTTSTSALRHLREAESALTEMIEAGTPAPEPEPPPSDALFFDDFETGDFRRWGGPEGDPGATGLWRPPDIGAHRGQGYLQSEVTHSGSWAWRAEVNPATHEGSDGNLGGTKLENWGVELPDEFSLEAWYYVPVDYPDVSYTNLMQIKERATATEPHGPVFVLGGRSQQGRGVRLAQPRDPCAEGPLVQDHDVGPKG